MTRRAAGLGVAALGALVLTPDALLLRLSGMDGLQMLGWRGLCMGTVFLALSRVFRGTAPGLSVPLGAAAVVTLCHYFNALLFPLGIANAPVAAVLLGLATVPVWAAVLARLIYREATARATWVAIAVVLGGIALAVSGKGEVAFDRAALLGVLCGLGVALTLALNFVTLRHNPGVQILPAIGLGALLAGATGVALTGPAAMTGGTVLPVLVTGLVILPVSFFSLSWASRHTSAANVSLLMLLETVLGPLWVWLGTDEAPGARMLAGGVIVVTSLAIYLLVTARAAPRRDRRLGGGA